MLNPHSLRRQVGVSIIEMMTVVVVLSIVTAVAMPSFSGWLERQRVRSAAEGIHTGIQLARVEALSRNAKVRFTLQPSGGWSVACASASAGAGCADTADLHTASGAEGSGSFGITVNSAVFSAGKSVDFLPQGSPDTTITGYIQQVDIAVAAGVDASSVSRALRINLTPFGRTRMCYPHGTAGDATAC